MLQTSLRWKTSFPYMNPIEVHIWTSLEVITINHFSYMVTEKNFCIYSMEGLMLKLKLQYFGHLMWRVDSLEKTLMLGGIGGGEGNNRGWDGWMASPTRRAWVWANSRSLWWTGRPGVLWFMGSQRVWHNWATELNWIYSQIKWLHLQ